MLVKFYFILKNLFLRIFFSPFYNIDYKQRISFSTIIKSTNNGILKIRKGLCTRRNVTIHADGGIIDIDKSVFLNQGCILVSQKKIQIGENSCFGPNVMIFDHDHDYELGSGFLSSDIIIGKNVWVGANCVILKGSIIEDNVVVGAGSVIKGNLKNNSIVYVNQNFINKYRGN